jgi:PEP-CTERM motif
MNFLDLLKERAMKLAVLAASALTLMSVGVANAAVASYNFENAELNAIGLSGSTPNFTGGLQALGVTSSTLSGTTGGQRGVYNNGQAMNNVGPNPINFGIGNTGETWTLIFGGLGLNSFQFAYNESEVVGFTVTAFGLDGTTVLGTTVFNPVGTAASPCQLSNTCGTITLGSFGSAIGKITILDRGNDGVQIDNLVVNTVDGAVPEPSTYLMVGSALAGLAAFRRRRA